MHDTVTPLHVCLHGVHRDNFIFTHQSSHTCCTL